jgi:hypothetical protein
LEVLDPEWSVPFGPAGVLNESTGWLDTRDLRARVATSRLKYPWPQPAARIRSPASGPSIRKMVGLSRYLRPGSPRDPKRREHHHQWRCTRRRRPRWPD